MMLSDVWRLSLRQLQPAAVGVGTWWSWETAATLPPALPREVLRRPRGRRGAGAYRGGRPPTACLGCSELMWSNWSRMEVVFRQLIRNSHHTGTKVRRSMVTIIFYFNFLFLLPIHSPRLIHNRVLKFGPFNWMIFGRVITAHAQKQLFKVTSFCRAA